MSETPLRDECSARFRDPVEVPSGVPGLDLVHLPTTTVDDGLPFDGEWSVTMSGQNMGVQRCPFRTFHAAAHYAIRIAGLADWTLPYEEVRAALVSTDAAAALRHAEAHAHEIDAVWPIGNVIPFGNGPSIVDDDGTTRRFMRQAPSIEWKRDEESTHRCATCGEMPKLWFDWMDRPDA